MLQSQTLLFQTIKLDQPSYKPSYIPSLTLVITYDSFIINLVTYHSSLWQSKRQFDKQGLTNVCLKKAVTKRKGSAKFSKATNYGASKSRQTLVPKVNELAMHLISSFAWKASASKPL